MNFTHKDLIPIAYRWVLKHASCGCAFKELVSANEICDVIGFGSGQHSVLVEVKVSRSDFLCDKKKPFRINSEQGMGYRRFYMCPDGLIKISELPNGWGLIYVDGSRKSTCVFNPYNSFIQIPPSVINEPKFYGLERNEQAERSILYSALRRLHLKGHTKEL